MQFNPHSWKTMTNKYSVVDTMAADGINNHVIESVYLK